MLCKHTALYTACKLVSLCFCQTGTASRKLDPAMENEGSIKKSGEAYQYCSVKLPGEEQKPGFDRITESQNSRGWKGPLWVI